MKKYYAYIDESGTHNDSQHEAVSLVLISALANTKLAATWSKLLDQWGLSVFHMTDFNSRRKEFSDWSAGRCHEFSIVLLETVRQHVTFWMGQVFETEQRHLVEDDGAAISLYLAGCMMSLRTLEEWANSQREEIQIEYVFEQGVKDQRALDRAISKSIARDEEKRSRFRYESHRYDKKSVPGLQIADIFAWQLFRDARRIDEQKNRRGDFKALLDIPHLVGHFDAEALRLLRLAVLAPNDA